MGERKCKGGSNQHTREGLRNRQQGGRRKEKGFLDDFSVLLKTPKANLLNAHSMCSAHSSP